MAPKDIEKPEPEMALVILNSAEDRVRLLQRIAMFKEAHRGAKAPYATPGPREAG